MITPSQVKASYRQACRQHISVRRYTTTGTNRTYNQVDNVRCRITGYAPNELVAGILQGDRRAVIYAPDVAAGGITALKNTDKLIVGGRELAIIAVDDMTRRVGDELVAYEVQARG